MYLSHRNTQRTHRRGEASTTQLLFLFELIVVIVVLVFMVSQKYDGPAYDEVDTHLNALVDSEVFVEGVHVDARMEEENEQKGRL